MLEPSSLGRREFNSKVVEFLFQNKLKIKSEWGRQVNIQIPESETQSSRIMSNSLDIFMDEFLMTLQLGQVQTVDLLHQRILQNYGETRAAISGYFLPQLLREFSILREVINNKLQRAGLLSYEVRNLLDTLTDDATSTVATEFARVQIEKVEIALAKANASNVDLEQFASIAAHDLKAPLATISGFLELIREERKAHGDKDIDKYIDVLTRTAKRVMDLVDRLLDYARLNRQHKSLSEVDVEELLTGVIENLSVDIKGNNALVSHDRLPIIYGDRDLLAQVFQNLIGNGIKYRRSDENPHVHIGMKNVDDSKWTFFIRDNGVGFDPRYKDEVFTLYRQLDSQAEQQGAGIGLATCRKVIELHGGKIWSESKQGVGSTFYFSIPKDLRMLI